MSSPASSFGDRVLQSPVTWLVTAINLGTFVIAATQGEMNGLNLSPATLLHYGALERDLVWSGDYWRLLTAVFLHVGWIHLLWNTWAMFGWCASIERAVGSGAFAFAYLSTGIGAFAVSVLAHPAFSAGASGAGFGMIAVTLAMLYRRFGSWGSFMGNPQVRQVLGMTLAWVVIGFTATGVRMDNFAHLGGFALGVPCGLLLEARRGARRPAWIASVAAYSIGVAALVVAACIPGLGLKG